jgi:cytochrome c oxidase assembly protein subunit 15
MVDGARNEGRYAGVVTVAFGTTVAIWAVAYFGRLPTVLLPSQLLLSLMLVCPFVGGLLLGRRSPRAFVDGIAAGGLAGLLNMMILGSLLADGSPNAVTPTALLWVPGSILVTGLLAGAGAALGSARRLEARTREDWAAIFAGVAVTATLLLVAAGGLVTSAKAGLAVVDWPNSFGYNMFLYPFSRMTGNIYYEHAHRLFGALVGMTTLVLAFFLQRVDARRGVRRLAWAALGLVVVQGLLGGLRVTGHLTLSQSPAETAPRLDLALVHGVLAQLFLATLVALAAFTSSGWRAADRPLRRPGVATDRRLAGLLVALVIAQLVLGATQRHYQKLLIVHIVVGVALVAPLAVHVGFRSWGLNVGQRRLQRLGLALAGAVSLQLLLGFATFAVTGGVSTGGIALILPTAHQWFGAVLLGLAVLLFCWEHRSLAPTPEAGPVQTADPQARA